MKALTFLIRGGALSLGAMLAASAALAQPGAASPENYGDRQSGQFGDPGQGYFGNAAAGDFRRYGFNRDQEGSVPVLPATPMGQSTASPSAAAATQAPSSAGAAAPYVVLQAPIDKKKTAGGSKTP